MSGIGLKLNNSGIFDFDFKDMKTVQLVKLKARNWEKNGRDQ